MKKQEAFPLLFLITMLFYACSSFLGRQPDNSFSYSVKVQELESKEVLSGIDISFWAYYTGTFGRAYLLEDQKTTDANGLVTFTLEYDDEVAQEYKDSVESITEEPVFQISIDGLYSVWNIFDQNGTEYPPVIGNRELAPGTELTYEVTRLAAFDFVMVDTLNPQLADEVRVSWRQLVPTPPFPVEGSLIHQELFEGPISRAIPADADVEITWETFEGPDLGSLQKTGEGIDTVNVPFGQMGSLTIYH